MSFGFRYDDFLCDELVRDTGAGPALGLGQNVSYPFDCPDEDRQDLPPTSSVEDDRDFRDCFVLVYARRW